MDVWRTSGPRLTVWEDAVEARAVAYLSLPGQPALLEVTERGRRLLHR